MLARRLIVVAIVLLVAAQTVRNAAVVALSPLHPATAARFWAGHPWVEISLGLANIGLASRDRELIGEHTFALINDAATKAPLSSSPFLVRGVRAQTQDDAETAKRAFLEAQWRDPRSLPAAYFLANYYFRVGDTLNGLEQTAVVARLSPSGLSAVAPYVAAYARDPANWPRLRALFRSQVALEDPTLLALAQSSDNADALLALADSDHRRPDSLWLRTLLHNMVASGDYARARAIWSSVGGGHGADTLIFDPAFSAPGPPPPFNWAFASSTVGLAERQQGKRLHLIFYGNEDGVLASQLLVLPAGKYRLLSQLVGEAAHPESLKWSIRCDKTQEPIAMIGMDQVAKSGWNFEVPANCPAQWLELTGRAGDIAQQSDVTITGFSLTRVSSND